MAIFYPKMRDFLDRLNELAAAAYIQIQADWTAPAGSAKAILNKPTLAAVATSGAKADVGLSNVDNTADKDKPISTAVAAALTSKADNSAMTTALAAKAPSANPVFTGTVSGVTKSMVGLGNVDNTSDTNKPISTAVATALSGKQASLGFTPVQQGGGVNQGPNKVYIGWGSDGGRLKLTVDSTYLGNFAMENESNAFSVAQTFNDRLISRSASFTPGANWIYAAVVGAGAYGGGLAVRDDNGGGGGCIYALSSVMRLQACALAGPTGTAIEIGGNYIMPTLDRGMYLGMSNARWDTVFAYTSSINTSDARWKTPVAALDDAELRWAVALAKELGTYQFLLEVESKGADVARLHAGMTVQRAMELGEAQGLDPLRYAFICHDSWDEKVEEFPAEYGPNIEHPAEYREVAATDDEPAHQELVSAAYTEPGALVKEASTVTTPAGDVYSFRTGELNLFIARGLAARYDALEARVAALEPS